MTKVDCSPRAADYLMRQMGCDDHLDREAQELARAAERGDALEYYETAQRDGEAPGRWRGALVAELGFTNGQVVDADDVRAVLAELKNPRTGEQLGSTPKKASTRRGVFEKWLEKHPEATAEDRLAEWNRLIDQKSTPTAFYDLTFSAQKSVSVYEAAARAAGQTELADAVLRAHRTAEAAAMRHLEANTWTRTGDHTPLPGGGTTGRFEQVEGVVSIEFDHSTSRSRDPHMHTHVAVLNRVKCRDGKWRAIHGQAWRKIKAEVAGVYEDVLAQEIEAHTPARFVMAENGLAREIAGIDPEVIQASSKRTKAIDAAQAEAEKRFREEHGRAPTAKERGRLHRMAWASSREAKSHLSPGQQLEEWAAAFDVNAIMRESAAAGRDIDWYGRPDAAALPDPTDREAVITAAIHTCQSRATVFNPGELAAEIRRQLPVQVEGRDREAYVIELRDEALARPAYGVVNISRPEPLPAPGWWREEDGRAEWRDPAGTGVLTTREQLTTERDIVTTARQRRGEGLTRAQLRDAEQELRAKGLSADQIHAVLGVLGSTRVADVLASPAGTGKSFTVGQLADQWERRTGGSVVGLATSQIATDVLQGDGLTAINTTRFLQAYEPDPRTGVPQARLGHRDMLVLDESNMTSTDEIARVQRIAHAAGAKILYTGDPKQLQAVGAGGMLGHLARENGHYELETVHRFANDWEKDASLRLRDRDLDVVDVYARHGRISTGTEDEMRRRAVINYVHDAAIKGLRSVLVTESNAQAADVSREVQEKLSGMGKLGYGIEVDRLADGNHAKHGDLVQARMNDWHAKTTGKVAAVVNRERYVVQGWSPSREHLIVRREDNAGEAWLPREYVENHLVLGYAGTEHSVEGVSVDTGHALTAGYVALTRGKQRNDVYLATFDGGDEHQAPVSTTAREALRDRLQATSEELTAVERHRGEIAQNEHMQTLVGIWDYTGREVDDYRHSDVLLDQLGKDYADRIQMESGAPGLYEALRRAEAHGHNVEQLLHEVINERPLYRVDDLAAVLRHRVEKKISDETAGHSWSGNTVNIPGPLGTFRQELAGLMDSREREIGRQAADTAAEWAVGTLGPVPDAANTEQRAEWERRAAHIGSYRELRGAAENSTELQLGSKPDGWLQRMLWLRAQRAAGVSPEALDFQLADTSQLREWAQQAERAAAWAPEHVAEDLGTARRLAHRSTSEAALARARADSVDDQAERDTALREAELAEQLADRMSARAEQLGVVQRARELWLQQTAQLRQRAEQARAELIRRGEQLAEAVRARAEQLPLFSGRLALRTDLDEADVAQSVQLADDYADLHAWRSLQEHLHGADEAQRREQETEQARLDAERVDALRPEFSPAHEAAADQAPAEVRKPLGEPVTEQQVEADDAQLSLFTDEQLAEGNARALAEVETTHTTEDLLDSSPDSPLVSTQSVRQAQVRAEYAVEVLQRRQAREWAEAAALEAETARAEFQRQQEAEAVEADVEREAEV